MTLYPTSLRQALTVLGANAAAWIRRARRGWRALQPHACPLCGTRLLPTGLPDHLEHKHTPAQLRAYLEEVKAR